MSDLIDDILLELPTTKNVVVPNKFPTITNLPYKLAIIGEAPSEQEVEQGKPFVGASGNFLNQLLEKAGLQREACFIGNVCQHRPDKNNIQLFAKDGQEFTYGRQQLAQDLATFNPNLCLLLGRTALRECNGSLDIGNWRGSLLMGSLDGALKNRKCLASYHPAFCLRSYDCTPLLLFDLKRAAREAQTATFTLPQRNLKVNMSVSELLLEMEKIIQTKPTISIDIEGGVSTMSCISISPSPDYSFIVPFSKLNGQNYYENESDELAVWKSLACILQDKTIRKVLQNSLYDRFVVHYSYGITIANTHHDTMLKHWELYCELEKSLGFQCSIYTNEPFYKSDRHSTDSKTFFEYCCRDSAVTLEISNKLDKYTTGVSLDHYRLNMNMLNPFLYMELRGMKYDSKLAEQRSKEVSNAIYALQYKLDKETSHGFDDTLSRELIRTMVQEELCMKRNKEVPLKKDRSGVTYKEIYDTSSRILLSEVKLQPSDIGYLHFATDTHLNVNSSKELLKFLYTILKLPVQYKLDPKTKERRPTANFDALLTLTKKTTNPCIHTIIGLRLHLTKLRMLSITPSKDGRMRESLNIVGSETGRVSSSKSSDWNNGERVGTNMQTISDDWDMDEEGLELVAQGLRELYVADEGCYIGQCDLKGADGWTVGAWLKKLGDPTMLDDLLFGLKPAQIVAYNFRCIRSGTKPIAKNAPRQEVKELVKSVKKEDWEYFFSKQGIWGTCYTMGPKKLAERAHSESFGKVMLTEDEVRQFQYAIKLRYQVDLWHRYMTQHLKNQPYPPKLVSPSGHVRKFFGRRDEILGQALAHEPQSVTTYATNLAAWRLWTDPENRAYNSNGKCTLRIEPLHQVHDALLVQWRISDTTWAIRKIREWFNNQITIAGQRITIPFDGAYGKSWGDLKEGVI